MNSDQGEVQTFMLGQLVSRISYAIISDWKQRTKGELFTFQFLASSLAPLRAIQQLFLLGASIILIHVTSVHSLLCHPKNATAVFYLVSKTCTIIQADQSCERSEERSEAVLFTPCLLTACGCPPVPQV